MRIQARQLWDDIEEGRADIPSGDPGLVLMRFPKGLGGVPV
jgi:hypothetical protein